MRALLWLWPLILCALMAVGIAAIWIAVEVEEYRWRRNLRRTLDRIQAERAAR